MLLLHSRGNISCAIKCPFLLNYLPGKHNPYKLTLMFLLCCYLAFLVSHSETNLQGVSKFVLQQNSVFLGATKRQLMLFHRKSNCKLVSLFCHPLFPSVGFLPLLYLHIHDSNGRETLSIKKAASYSSSHSR